MKNKKGFTLIELLAVIIILGVLLLIAVPAVSKYIINSRKNTYINTVKGIVDSVKTSVNALEYPAITNGEGLLIPFSEVELEKGSKDKSPFGKYEEGKSYVIVTFDGVKHDYYAVTLDSSGYALPMIKESELSTSSISTDAVKINKNVISVSDINRKELVETDVLTFKEYSKSGNIIKLKIYRYIAKEILKDNEEKSDSGLNFGTTIGSGLYYTSTNTLDNKTTYYFRGNINNNYVLFGTEKISTPSSCTYNGEIVKTTVGLSVPEIVEQSVCEQRGVCQVNSALATSSKYVISTKEQCINTSTSGYNGTWIDAIPTWKNAETQEYPILWRIVRINEYGSIRLIKENSLDTVVFNDINNTGMVDQFTMGYMFGGDPSNQTNTLDSTIKKYLDDWYENNLKDNYSTYMIDAGFCNDREVNNENMHKYYSGYARLITNKNPMFKCQNQSRDLFTVSTASYGNKSLTYPIGLLTADEASFAGEVQSKINPNNYLNNGSTFWTMTPSRSMQVAPTYVFKINGDTVAATPSGGTNVLNSLDEHVAQDKEQKNIKARPVINIKGNLEVSSGNGTKTNPYLIKTN